MRECGKENNIRNIPSKNLWWRIHVTQQYELLINGEKVATEEHIPVRNPANITETVGLIPKATRDHLNAAVDAAYDAFHSAWSTRSNSRNRGKVMLKAVELIKNDLENLSRLYTMEQGKPLKESRSEIESFLNTTDFFAGYGGKIYGDENVAVSNGDELWTIDRPEPLGVLVAIAPWNFEISLLGWKLAPALVCGNTVVVKPSSSTPLTTLRMMEHFYAAGLPKGVVNVVTGSSSEIGDHLVSHAKVRKVMFTGSTEVGKHVYQTAAQGIRAVTLELGGSDPTVVCDDADLDDAARNIIEKGRFRNCGQSCTSVKRVYVFESIADRFVKLLQEFVSKINVGNGLDPTVTMGPLHNEDQRKSVEYFVEDARRNRAARVLTGGKRPQGERFEHGHFYEPTLLADVPEDAHIWKEECFGPALPIAIVSNLNEAIEKANKSSYGLGSGIWTKSLERAYKFANEIESGIVWINSPPLSVPETSFGGVKDSGTGRELGQRAIMENMEPKSVRIRFSS
jgi:acyl-CoA reductase-like NAD-dependent aldehyde dehydrogenase